MDLGYSAAAILGNGVRDPLPDGMSSAEAFAYERYEIIHKTGEYQR